MTHDASLYGAARSLGTLLKAYRDVDRDLVLSRRGGTYSDAQLQDRFGAEVVLTGRRALPFSRCYRGAPSGTLELDVLRPAAWILERGRFYRWLDRRAYDAIHLNSLTLHPVVRPDFPFIVHVREIAAGTARGAARSLERAAGVVFIDAATRGPFRSARLSRSIVLNNPFDMRGVGSSPGIDLDVRIGAGARDVVVYAILGVLRPEKGIEFVIEAFRRSRRTDVRLLVVGWGTSEMTARCRELAGGDPRIVLWGEEGRIDALYADVDYVVRGEPYACIGRTIYEGLFAGTAVVIPGAGDDRAVFDDRERFGSRIHEYPPRDSNALSALVDSLPKVSRGVPGSNVEEYVSRFDAFVRSIHGSPSKTARGRGGTPRDVARDR